MVPLSLFPTIHDQALTPKSSLSRKTMESNTPPLIARWQHNNSCASSRSVPIDDRSPSREHHLRSKTSFASLDAFTKKSNLFRRRTATRSESVLPGDETFQASPIPACLAPSTSTSLNGVIPSPSTEAFADSAYSSPPVSAAPRFSQLIASFPSLTIPTPLRPSIAPHTVLNSNHERNSSIPSLTHTVSPSQTPPPVSPTNQTSNSSFDSYQPTTPTHQSNISTNATHLALDEDDFDHDFNDDDEEDDIIINPSKDHKHKHFLRSRHHFSSKRTTSTTKKLHSTNSAHNKSNKAVEEEGEEYDQWTCIPRDESEINHFDNNPSRLRLPKIIRETLADFTPQEAFAEEQRITCSRFGPFHPSCLPPTVGMSLVAPPSPPVIRRRKSSVEKVVHRLRLPRGLSFRAKGFGLGGGISTRE